MKIKTKRRFANPRYYDIVSELDDSKFVKVGKKVTPKNIEALTHNLWSMFDIKFTPEQRREFNEKPLDERGEEPFGMSVSDYAWTTEVQQAFFNHLYNAAFIKQLKKQPVLFSMWVLDNTPADY